MISQCQIDLTASGNFSISKCIFNILLMRLCPFRISGISVIIGTSVPSAVRAELQIDDTAICRGQCPLPGECMIYYQINLCTVVILSAIGSHITFQPALTTSHMQIY